jgi:hypothetical protein
MASKFLPSGGSCGRTPVARRALHRRQLRRVRPRRGARAGLPEALAHPDIAHMYAFESATLAHGKAAHVLLDWTSLVE